MKKIFGILFALVLMMGLGLVTAAPDGTGGPAYAAEAQAMSFAGTVRTLSPAGPVAAGMLVQAFVGTELRAETTTEAEGLYRNLVVLGPGGTVTFRVAGVLAQESITWESGEIMEDFDLTIPALASAGYSLTMTVSPAGKGTATDVTNASPYQEGAGVGIKAVAATGYRFSSWTAVPMVSFDKANAAATTFTMPAADVIVTANFALGGPTSWYVVEGGAGTRDGCDWDNAFPTIQEGIDAAGSGDTIMVAAGDYDAFVVDGKPNISIMSTEGATVTTAMFIEDLPVVGSAWAMAVVYESQNIKIEGIDFDGAGVTGTPVAVGIAYVDSTGSIDSLTVENVIATELGAGVAIIGHVSTSTVETTRATISNNDNAGIYVCGGSTLEAHFNSIIDNAQFGLFNDGGKTADATSNWWGHTSGPQHPSNPSGRGNAVMGDADFEPWLGAETVTQKITDFGIVNATEADTTVRVTGNATVSVAKSELDPTGGLPPPGTTPLGRYIDVYISDATEVEEIEIRHYYTDDDIGNISKLLQRYLRLRWWDGKEWRQYSDGGVNTDSTGDYAGYIWGKVRANTEPSLEDLKGTWNEDFFEGPDIPTCFSAAVAFGTNAAQKLNILREFRDEVMLPNALGARLVPLYYRGSPPIASFISQHDVLTRLVRLGFLDPIVKILNWSHDLWSARGP